MLDWLWILLFTVLFYVLLQGVKMRYRFRAWGIPHPTEIPFLGMSGASLLLRNHACVFVLELRETFKEAKYAGYHVFSTPFIAVFDPELAKSVLVKHFDHFADHKAFVDERVDPLFGKNLLFLNGERWREVRSILSPSFTSSKMRSMHGLMSRCAKNFVEQFLENFGGDEAVDLKDAFTRFANDVIASCAFGIEIDSLKDRENEFYTRGTRTTKFTGLKRAKIMLQMILPALGSRLGIRMISREDTDFFASVIETTMRMREESGATRPDMLQLLIEAKDRGGLDSMELTAQAFIFFLAGFETTSAQMCMIAHELATNPEVQRRLQDEIDSTMRECNGEPTYEAINGMAYLDAVFSETLRKHSLPFVSRLCTKDYEFPPAEPHMRPFLVKAGTQITVPVVTIHHDPEIYEEPEEFRPERFLGKRATTSDSQSMGFGLGPRMCIGNRFAILETKVLFVHLLSRCTLSVCAKTCLPLRYDPGNFTPSPKGGSWLRVTLREE